MSVTWSERKPSLTDEELRAMFGTPQTKVNDKTLLAMALGCFLWGGIILLLWRVL